MAKVGIITFHYALNYGAVLQAYALARAVEQMGHQVQVIDYRSPGTRRHYYPRGFRNWGLRGPGGLAAAFIRRRRFRQFREQYLPLSACTYLGYDDLVARPPHADCFICGSDQVWNIRTPSCSGLDPVFFLALPGSPEARRISYAPCFGQAELGDHTGAIRALLSRFDHLSVRDTRSGETVSQLLGREAVHVLDPSLLVDYDPITPPRLVQEPYVLVYCVDPNPFMERAAALLRRLTGWRIVSVNARLPKARMIATAGPLEWLSLVRYADFVCTDSFHGTCFSLLWKKQFATLPIGGGKQFRLEDILETAGLADRLVASEEQLASVLYAETAYDEVDRRLYQARKRSKEFLLEALG